jgi:hypothetical protein
MEKIFVENRRKVIWKERSTRLFQGFSEDLKDKMEREDLTYHYHKYTITTDSFAKISDTLRVTQVDKTGDIDYVIAFDALNYPMFGTLYHPEYMDIIMCNGYRFWPKSEEADEISLQLSKFVNKIAKNNSNVRRGAKLLEGVTLVKYEIAPKAFVWVYQF